MDSFKKMALSLLLLSLLLYNASAAAAAAEPLRHHSCSTTGSNYTSTGPFVANLNRLLRLLFRKAPPIGFGLGSIGQGPGRVHGLALCRGDVRSSSCITCIRAASSEIRRLCPLRKDAVVWLDSCLLRYSDAEFFGEVDDKHEFFFNASTSSASSSSSSSTAAAEFDSRVMEMMSSLRAKAYLSPLLFATRVMGFGRLSKEKMYGLAQCSRDLSGGDCNKCLEKAIAVLPGCCGGRRGGRVVGGSCYVRYELHPFFHDA